MEGDSLRLDLALLDINLATAEDDGDILTNTDEVTVPIRDVLVRDTRSHIEHDDAAFPVDVVSISETSEFLLTGRIPHIELNGSQVLFTRVSHHHNHRQSSCEGDHVPS